MVLFKHDQISTLDLRLPKSFGVISDSHAMNKGKERFKWRLPHPPSQIYANLNIESKVCKRLSAKKEYMSVCDQTQDSLACAPTQDDLHSRNQDRSCSKVY